MKAIVHLCKTSDCTSKIEGKEQECFEYSELISKKPQEFTYLDTITINQVIRYNSLEQEMLKEYLVVPHKLIEIDGNLYNDIDSVDYTFKEDGVYKITHLILPTLCWIANFKKAFGVDPTSVYGLVVVYVEGCIYLYDGLKFTKISADELFELNNLENMSFVSTCIHTFSMCKLMECFYKICKNLLKELCPLDCSKSDVKVLIERRDLLWMAINVIKYLLEKEDYFEAARILELFEGCSGFCNDNYNNKGGCGCGCHSKNKRQDY